MIDNQKQLSGTIIKGIGGFYYVSTSEGVIECRAQGKFRNKELCPMVGDNVTLLVSPDGSGSVNHIFERKNFLVRPEVSNIDVLVLVCAMRSPMPDYLLTDKLLVTAESKNIRGVICLNKTDLAQDDEVCDFADVYKKAGYRVIIASAKTGEGTDELRDIIKGHTVCFAGLSGVGKSSLLKRVTGIDLKTGSVSKIERGKHTTRHIELIETSGGFVFDTPGFSRLETKELYANDLWKYFPEIANNRSECRFRTCNHVGEPGCSIKNCVENGLISPHRYENYVLLFNQLKEIKDWQRKDLPK